MKKESPISGPVLTILIQRIVLGFGPPQFLRWFFLAIARGHSYCTRLQGSKHRKQLHNYLQSRYTELFRRSPLGLTQVYNELPQEAVDATSVKDFQAWLQDHLKELASKELDN